MVWKNKNPFRRVMRAAPSATSSSDAAPVACSQTTTDVELIEQQHQEQNQSTQQQQKRQDEQQQQQKRQEHSLQASSLLESSSTDDDDDDNVNGNSHQELHDKKKKITTRPSARATLKRFSLFLQRKEISVNQRVANVVEVPDTTTASLRDDEGDDSNSSSVKKSILRHDSSDGLRDPPPPPSSPLSSAGKTEPLLAKGNSTTPTDVAVVNVTGGGKNNIEYNSALYYHDTMDHPTVSHLCGSTSSFHDDVMLETTESMFSCDGAEQMAYTAYLNRTAAAVAAVPTGPREQQQPLQQHVDTTTTLRQEQKSRRATATGPRNSSTINEKEDFDFFDFDFSCQAPHERPPNASDAPVPNVDPSFDAATNIPDIILSRSLIAGDVNITVLLECDYIQNCTPLYKQLEQENWQGVDGFLATGIWPGALAKDPISPSKQARTWVTRFDEHDATKIHWSVLPLHISIILGAPKSTIEHLVTLFPLALQCVDHQRLLPFDLAVRHESSVEVIEYLYTAFPDAIHYNKGERDDGPADLERIAFGISSDREQVVLGTIHAKPMSPPLPPSPPLQNHDTTNDKEANLVHVVSSLVMVSGDYVSRFASSMASTLASSSPSPDNGNSERTLARPANAASTIRPVDNDPNKSKPGRSVRKHDRAAF